MDEKNNPTEKRTDNILMKLKDDESGFIMVSRKTGKEEGVEEYTTSLIDTTNNTSISMVYTNGLEFPHKILLVNGEETMIGYTSDYRKETQDFDIIWYSEDGNGESCENIPLKTTIYNHVKTAGVDDKTDYQIKTIKISVNIAEAINKYAESNNNSRMLRGSFWNALWRIIFAPIAIVIVVVVSIFVKPLRPYVKPIIGAILGLTPTFEQIDNGIKSAPGEKALIITKEIGGDYYQDGDIIYLEKVGDEAHIYLDILNEPVDYLKVRLYRDNDSEPHRMASAYFDFTAGKEYSPLLNEYIVKEDKLKNDEDVHIKIKRRDLTKEDLNLFIIIETGNNVMINRDSSSELKLILK